MKHTTTRKKRHGAVMIEAVLAISAFTLAFAGILFVHQLAAADLRAADRARQVAWEHASRGCGASGFAISDMVRQMRNGELPIPNALLPHETGEGTAQVSVTGLFARLTRSSQRTVRIPCSSARVSNDDQNNNWLMELTE